MYIILWKYVLNKIYLHVVVNKHNFIQYSGIRDWRRLPSDNIDKFQVNSCMVASVLEFHLVLRPKESSRIEGVVLLRVGILGYFSS